MEDVVIVSGARTAIGRFQGAFANLPASDLGAIVIKAAVERAGLKPEQVDQVILGCVGQVMEDAYISRHAAVKAGLPVETPAVTVNRICGSGLEAINTAARWIQTGDAEVVVAGGAENMTMMPYYLRNARAGYRLGNGHARRRHPPPARRPLQQGQHMGITAENLAEKYEVSREAQDEVAVRSQERAAAAIAAGKFKDEIVPVEVKQGRETVTIDTDEHPRADLGGGARQAARRLQGRRHGHRRQRQRHQRRRRRARRHERGQGAASSASSRGSRSSPAPRPASSPRSWARPDPGRAEGARRRPA